MKSVYLKSLVIAALTTALSGHALAEVSEETASGSATAVVYTPIILGAVAPIDFGTLGDDAGPQVGNSSFDITAENGANVSVLYSADSGCDGFTLPAPESDTGTGMATAHNFSIGFDPANGSIAHLVTLTCNYTVTVAYPGI